MTRASKHKPIDRCSEFFARLAQASKPQLHDVTASIRFDLDDAGTTRHWHITIDHGTITVTRRNARADAVLRTDLPLFERVIAGEANPLTAALRGRLRIDGDARLLVAVKRLLPGPPNRTTMLPASDVATGATTTARARQQSGSSRRRERAR